MHDFTVEREDGRVLQCCAAGADAGAPVVYLHGSPSSRLDIDDLHERSLRRGVQVVSFDRPGYGGSAYTPFTFTSIANDVAAVADHLGADRVPVAGQSSGAAYALGAAALRPDRVSAVAVNGGGAPFRPDLPWWEHLSEREQRGVRLIGVDDDEAERLLAEADLPFIRILDNDDAAVLDFWRGHCGPADQRLLDERFGPVLVRSVRESSRPGQVGWARDNLVRMGEWDFSLAQIRCPTTIWYGEQDEWRPGPWLVERIPRAQLRVEPGHGHFLLFAEWDRVLDSLLVVDSSTTLPGRDARPSRYPDDPLTRGRVVT